MNFKNNFKNLNEKVWQAKSLPTCLTNEDIDFLENHAKKNKLRQFRYCFHTNNQDPMQQMLIFHTYPQVINWHCQPKGGMVFYYVVKGQVDIILDTSPKKIFKLASSSKYLKKNFLSMISIPKEIFRRVSTNSKNSIFLEISSGDFKDSDTLWKI